MRILMRSVAIAAAAALCAVPAAAQDGGMRRPGPGGPPAIPDHWMTLDSLAQAVELAGEQRGKVAEPFNALNAVMRDAAQRRRALRQEMQTQLAGRSPQELTDAERARMRARGDSLRAELSALQAEVDLWHGAIRNALTAAQQEKFDALPKPSVTVSPVRRAPGGS